VLRVYNTLSRSLEAFEPIRPGRVTMYVCGPTVYDYTHPGHARTYVAFDVIKRYIRMLGYDVLHVQNITDIDDKIINRAREEGRDWRSIADEYTRDYLEALSRLNIRVDLHPRVTSHVREIVEFIGLLLEKGHAYVAPSGSVYFDVDSYGDYGQLSRRLGREEWRQEEFAGEKKNPYDFALWKAAKPGEPYWESPWGPGRPGWHIECSTMATLYLGAGIDIHGGGSDLIFPHHENERAQSEAALGVRPWVRYWLHTGMLQVGGGKMSKSLGNIVQLRELLSRWGPEAVRLWLATTHYRSVVSFGEEPLRQARANYERLADSVQALKALLEREEYSFSLSDGGRRLLQRMAEIREGFHRAMCDDFNTSEAFRHVYELTGLVFSEVVNRPEAAVVAKALALMEEFNGVLGVLDKFFAAGAELLPAERLVDLLVETRRRLREARLYSLSDWIRDQLLKLGIKLYDRGPETEWRVA